MPNICIRRTIPRIGWKGLCLEDSPLSVHLTEFASAGPAGVNAAATWDVDLIKLRSRSFASFYICTPLKGVGISHLFIVQGTGIGNEQEHFRGGSEVAKIYSSNIDDKTLRVFVALRCSYNRINQTQACQNSKLINGVLKEELGFQGFVVSDWAATINGVQTALAGLDMNMPGFIGYNIGPQKDPDPATATNSRWGAELIEMDSDYPDVSFSQLTEETFLNGELGIGIFGSDAGPHPDGPNNRTDNTAEQVFSVMPFIHVDFPFTPAVGVVMKEPWGSGTANFPYLIDPLAAISQHIQSLDPTVVIEGILDDFNAATQSTIAKLTDTFVFVNAGGMTKRVRRYLNVSENAGDRNNLTLWHGGETIITTVASECPNTIVVQQRPLPLSAISAVLPHYTRPSWPSLQVQNTGDTAGKGLTALPRFPVIL
ncbi:glycoside hydrolase superfamily [Mycena galopus ATCC 62051]|nr:glycoside hydrolase superfamily [Mycena galopus ATCC 62051]